MTDIKDFFFYTWNIIKSDCINLFNSLREFFFDEDFTKVEKTVISCFVLICIGLFIYWPLSMTLLGIILWRIIAHADDFIDDEIDE